MKVRDFLVSTALAVGVWLSPIHGLILAISVLVGVDTVYAIYYTVKMNGLASFTSHKLFNIVPKTVMYMGTIVFAFMVDNFFFEGQINQIPFAVTKIMTAVWCFIEIKSIDETRMKLGHKSFIQLIRDYYKKIKSLKKDLGEI